MSTDHIRYDLLTQEALRGVMQRVLADAAKHGLPGEHHFYIAFDTNAEGVKVSSRVKAQYPKEMTIVLQHQFWDLAVLEDRFEVGLAFGGVPERLVVPFSAIKGFFDPSVQFGLQFQNADGEDGRVMTPAPMQPGAADNADAAPASAAGETVVALPQAAGGAETPPVPAAENDKPEGGEVVQFDRFRKK